MRSSGLEPHIASVSSQGVLTVASVPKSYGEVRKALVSAGWQSIRQHGSHEVWAHPDRRQRIVVAGKNRDTVPVGTLGSIRKATGLKELR